MTEAAIVAKLRLVWPEKIAGLPLTFTWSELLPAQGVGRSIELVIQDDWLRTFRLEFSQKRVLAARWGQIQDDIERLALYALEPPPLYVP